MYYSVWRPGVLEVFCGPMKSGKTLEIINRVEKIQYMEGFDFLFVKPKMDTRDPVIKSRFAEIKRNCVFVDEKNPSVLLDIVAPQHKVVVIDEAQFFDESVIKVVEHLLLRDHNVIVAGLDLDFRGEPFGPMPELLAKAHIVHKLTAVCEVPGCSALASRTQRLVNGEPAPYDAPIILVGDEKEGYEPRCLKHHCVPGKTTVLLEEEVQ